MAVRLRSCSAWLAAGLLVAGVGCARIKPAQTAGLGSSQATPQNTGEESKSAPNAVSRQSTGEQPLLLADEVPETQPAEDSGADNSRCHVCHANYIQEVLAVTHARANIGCVNCHGQSDNHIADESWTSGGNGTPPDKIYTLPMVNPLCLSCHAREKIDTAPHQALFSGTTEKKYCTDCHGSHRLARRKCKWK